RASKGSWLTWGGAPTASRLAPFPASSWPSWLPCVARPTCSSRSASPVSTRTSWWARRPRLPSRTERAGSRQCCVLSGVLAPLHERQGACRCLLLPELRNLVVRQALVRVHVRLLDQFHAQLPGG